jgi:hypothetical protein
MTKEVKRLIKQLNAMPGVSVERSGSGHWKVKLNGGTRYVFAATASDHRSMKNAVAGLKREGLLPKDWR